MNIELIKCFLNNKDPIENSAYIVDIDSEICRLVIAYNFINSYGKEFLSTEEQLFRKLDITDKIYQYVLQYNNYYENDWRLVSKYAFGTSLYNIHTHQTLQVS